MREKRYKLRKKRRQKLKNKRKALWRARIAKQRKIRGIYEMQTRNWLKTQPKLAKFPVLLHWLQRRRVNFGMNPIRRKKKSKILGRIKAYPLSMYSFFLKNRKAFILPPSRKRFHVLKVLLLSFRSILQASVKKQFYFLSTLRNLLLSLITLPGFIPKFFLFRQINLFLIKEFSYRHLNVNFFGKIFRSRFLLFQGAFSALVASIKSFEKYAVIGITFTGLHVRNVTASLVCNYIIEKLGQYFTIQEILRPVISDLRRSPLLAGFKIIVAGRLTRKERAAFLIKKNGRMTLSQKDVRIDYSSDFKIMRFGLVGVKVWFQIKRKKPYLYRFNFLHYYVIILGIISLFYFLVPVRLWIIYLSYLLGVSATALKNILLLNPSYKPWIIKFVTLFFRFRITRFIATASYNVSRYMYQSPQFSEKAFHFCTHASYHLLRFGRTYRLAIIILPPGQYLPPSLEASLLLLIALNALWRAFIGLGNIIRTSKTEILAILYENIHRSGVKDALKTLLEGLNKPRYFTDHASTSTPPNPQENNSDNNSDNNKDKNDKSDNDKNKKETADNKNNTSWNKTNVSVAAGAFSFSIFAFWSSNKANNIAEKAKQDRHNEKMDLARKELQQKDEDLDRKQTKQQLKQTKQQLKQTKQQLQETEQQITIKAQQLKETEQQITIKAQQLKETELQEKSRALDLQEDINNAQKSHWEALAKRFKQDQHIMSEITEKKTISQKQQDAINLEIVDGKIVPPKDRPYMPKKNSINQNSNDNSNDVD